jgi:two-component system cell cycle sensor histidine kinase/response regulator CckA
MRDEGTTKDQLLQELAALQRRVAELEEARAEAMKNRKTLQESELKYRTLFIDSPEAVSVVQDGRIIDVNPAWLEMHGIDSKEEVLGKDVLTVIHPDDRHILDKLRLASRVERDRGYEIRDIQKNGNTIYVEVYSSAISLERRGAILTTLRDVTDRKQAEEALRKSEEKFRNLTECTSDWVWEANREGCYIYSNPRVTDLLGYAIEEMLGKTPFEFMDPEESHRLRNVFFNSSSRHESVGYLEATMVHKKGWPVTFETSRIPMLDARKHLVGYRGVGRDMTIRKRMETQLLTVRNLESIGTLAGGVAHDFNNLLTAVVGNISLARMSLSPEDKIFHYLDEAERIAYSGKKLTQQLAAFARGALPVKKVTTLNHLIRDVIRVALAGSKVKCRYFLADDLFLVEIDETQIRQVIHNIVVNAKEAMPNGGTLKVTAENIALSGEDTAPLPAGDYIRVSLQDTGAGVSAGDLSKIFDPYYSTKEMGVEKGMGLGLSIVYSIIKKHDGHIEVESTVNHGTGFTLYLPAYREKAEPKSAQEKVFEDTRKKILYMDDEKMLRDVGDKMIGYLGYEPVLAKDGHDAIRLYTEALHAGRPFDAVIFDLTIRGGMGGKETLHELLAVDPDITAVIASGYTDDPVVSDYFKYGFKGVITKPYKIDDLQRLLKNLIADKARK